MLRSNGFVRLLLVVFLLAGLALAAWALFLDFRVRHEFEGRRFALPARIYARPLELHEGLKLKPAELEQELKALGYKDGGQGESGWYRKTGGGLEVAVRPFVFWDGSQPAKRIRVSFADARISGLRDAADAQVPLARLDPLPIGGIYPAGNEDRLLVRLSEVPPHLVRELIATEDRRYYSHFGFDLRGMARAALSSVTGHVQGGSTLTQQLVKNFFLTPERSITRKVNELIMAVLLELHYDKAEILETYLNEIYLGQDRDRAIHGVGLAAQYFFGKPVQDLTVAESALLVGMIRGPSYYDPHRNPQRALERRNLVLKLAGEVGALTPEQVKQAQGAKLGVQPRAASGTTPYPAFVQLVQRQLRRDYKDEDLRSEGLRVFTTLDPRVQAAAERALVRRIEQYDRDKRFGAPGLEGAVIVAGTQTGEVQALVGGRDPRLRGFNRALDAARPIGSLLKPAIYLTALSDPSHYTLVTPLDDSPFVWKAAGAPDWKPENYDRKSHGMVPLRTALAQSYNLSTARLGTTLGVEKVLQTAQKLGMQKMPPPYASVLLGAVDLSPLEVAQMYETIASGGFRTPLRAIREVTTAEGKPLNHYSLSVEQAFPAEPIHLLSVAMQGVVSEGTAQALKSWIPPEIAAAGKTGTTDSQRDAWFAGFTGDRLAVVWLGYDDNREAHLSGGAAAVPVWGELMAALGPEPLALSAPENIETATIDPQTGLLGKGCPGAVDLPFIKGSAPKDSAPCAGGVGGAVEAIGRAVEDAVKPLKGWLDRLFGR
ncbi:MAG TPA: penicillin-binding protein 1B [Burkholderiales bacterium]|nr:penicillin-binding protein 1B [Burkholderiales bacterium]